MRSLCARVQAAPLRLGCICCWRGALVPVACGRLGTAASGVAYNARQSSFFLQPRLPHAELNELMAQGVNAHDQPEIIARLTPESADLFQVGGGLKKGVLARAGGAGVWAPCWASGLLWH